MKILTVTYSLGKGGVARTAATYAISYKKLGLDSRVLFFAAGGQRRENLNAEEILCWSGTDKDTLQEILDWNPDAVHIHSHLFGEAEMAWLDRIFPGRTVVEKNVFSRPVPWTHRMDYSYQLSTWCAWRFCNSAPELAHKAIIVPNGADSSAFVKTPKKTALQFRTEHGIPQDALVIGRIGQHYDPKWSPVLIDAFNRLSKTHSNLWLLLVNPPKLVRIQAEESPFSKHIIIIDKIIGDEALCTAYSAMDVFALAADQGESFGNVLAEAMLCEIPVVALSTPWKDNSQGEVTGQNIGGLVALTPKGFCRAIDTLLQDEPRRRALGQAGRARVIENYDCLKVAKISLNVIEGNQPPLDRQQMDQQIIDLYSDAFEKPSFLTLLFIRKRLLRLTRYTTHYWPIWKLPLELLKLAIKKIS